jgi:malonate-semialdehyde dehydrogenase (acetylating)/methylmalonate-semialdehyde dehydrogenase
MNLIEHFVNGKVFRGSSKRTSKVFNPAAGEQTSEVNLASKADVDVVVQKAREAFIDWSNKPPIQRARVILNLKN